MFFSVIIVKSKANKYCIIFAYKIISDLITGSKMNKTSLTKDMLVNLTEVLLNKWYPLCIDRLYGGYYSNLAFNWEVMPQQDKMIVTQARHIWCCSKAASFLDNDIYRENAYHGFKFLKDVMWDKEYGGFYQIRSREGGMTDYHNFMDEKRAYGNAFAVYGLAALHKLTGDESVLKLAAGAFNWIESNCFDKEYNGYFQFFTRENIPFDKNSAHQTRAVDASEAGYKDQNSSIHLLEAYTELYNTWKTPEVYVKLNNLLTLIRDKMVTDKGYLTLFFDRQLNPVSFINAPAEVREKNFGLDHVSFGHDYETAFLMLEASHSLGLNNDITTLRTSKKMVDHAINNGWDKINGGFFDEGYYFRESTECEIIKDTKVWWAQAEGLNALLLFSKIFPEEKKYYELFEKMWDYIKFYLIDKEFGDWYWGSLEKEPFYRTEPKGSIWKCTYHNGRALMNCIKMLADENFSLYKSNKKFRQEKKQFDEFINHWKETASNI
jgi:mannobiose 2-epimerase